MTLPFFFFPLFLGISSVQSWLLQIVELWSEIWESQIKKPTLSELGKFINKLLIYSTS